MAHDVLVIGGGPAGLSAALNVRARGRSVLVVSNPLEENPLWRAERVDNYIGLPGVSGAELLTAMRRHAEDAGAEFRQGKVLNAVRMGDTWYVSVDSDMENASAVILAAGIDRGKKFPGEAEFLGRGVSYCDRPKDCVISGRDRVESVTCGGETVPVEGVFLLRPTMAPTDVFPGLAVENGHVVVDGKMATNLPGLFAAGDCAGGPLQVSKAAGEGLVAGQSAAAYAASLARKSK